MWPRDVFIIELQKEQILDVIHDLFIIELQ